MRSRQIPGFDNHSADFVRTFTAHQPAIRAFVRKLVPTRDDADDILQEVAVVLWEKFCEFEPGTDFKAWAFSIARFKVLSLLRDRGRNKLYLANDVINLIAVEAAEEESQLQQQRAALDACFEKIPRSERDLLKLAYCSGTKMRDIAKTNGRSETGFYQWLYRLRQMLLDCVKRSQAEEVRST